MAQLSTELEKAIPQGIGIQGWKTLSLGLVCGYVDSYTLMMLGVYTSFMSGNTISTGMKAGQSKFAEAGHSLLPIPLFLVGAFTGALLQRGKTPLEQRRVFAVVALMLGLDIAATYFTAPQWVCISVLSMAMGMLNTTVSSFGGQSVNLGFVTGDLKNLGEHLANGITRTSMPDAKGPWDTHWRRAGLLSGIWMSFLVGAVLGGVAASRFGVWSLVLPILTLLVASLSDRKQAGA